MNISPSVFGDGIEAFPDSVAGVDVETSKLAVAIDAVDVLALQDGGRYAAMETIGICYAGAFSLPEFFNGEPVGVDFEPSKKLLTKR